MRFRGFGASALVVVALGSFVVACGDDDDDTAAGGSGGGDTELAEGEAPTVTITATDDVEAKRFTFEGISDLEKGGVFTVALDNRGEESHDLQFVKASSGRTLDDMLKVLDSDDAVPSWVAEAAGVGFTDGGATNEVSVDLEPGEYWYFCTESSGDDGSEQISHAENGMAGELTLEGDTGAALPDTEASIVAADYRFDVTGLKAGENTFTLRNDGKQLHHALAVPIAEGKTFADAQAALTSEEEPTGPPPVDFDNAVGTAVVSPGKAQVVTWDLKAGSYALLCFMPDYDKPGPPHVAKGMISELKVS